MCYLPNVFLLLHRGWFATGCSRGSHKESYAEATRDTLPSIRTYHGVTLPLIVGLASPPPRNTLVWGFKFWLELHGWPESSKMIVGVTPSAPARTCRPIALSFTDNLFFFVLLPHHPTESLDPSTQIHPYEYAINQPGKWCFIRTVCD